jgi:hypothetical protein
MILLRTQPGIAPVAYIKSHNRIDFYTQSKAMLYATFRTSNKCNMPGALNHFERVP